ncbi:MULTISPECIES: hypothetical protein [unclassified Xanthomonas]|uniref:hypothetical protein n=1 Tax=unclassified Xanthomonas TaxID=2643310 RepID=UPI002B22C452|nr:MULTISPECIES: hypothetical protein [unclassified Xanthomonas]MEA9563394.1 hypothetical protein [Xanthomonas sp. WHRI 8932A]MEA9634461.1 hypothetical protein [Xanthomonas sp. WHRI 8812E]
MACSLAADASDHCIKVARSQMPAAGDNGHPVAAVPALSEQRILYALLRDRGVSAVATAELSQPGQAMATSGFIDTGT